ncbi:hypothetical protein LXA43DRAFT_669988 [Ganoderma leucocontextum]|nr:hypothetical protein LXA43DRAFT_669988 [Ganoderma leucocontextum]
MKAEVLDAEFTLNVPTSSTASSASTLGAPSRAKVKCTNSQKPELAPFVYDLQPYKIVHTTSDATVRETLFSVVVSTSGPVAGYQLPEKAKRSSLRSRNL